MKKFLLYLVQSVHEVEARKEKVEPMQVFGRNIRSRPFVAVVDFGVKLNDLDNFGAYCKQRATQQAKDEQTSLGLRMMVVAVGQ